MCQVLMTDASSPIHKPDRIASINASVCGIAPTDALLVDKRLITNNGQLNRAIDQLKQLPQYFPGIVLGCFNFTYFSNRLFQICRTY